MTASGGPNTAQAFAPSRLRLYTAPFGTTMPADATTALASTFWDHGSLAEQGLSFNEEKTVNQQFDYEGNLIREVILRRTYTIAGTLLQQNANAEKLVYGGGVSAVAGGLATFTPPTSRTNTNFAAVLEWVDDTTSIRYLIPKVTASTGAQRPFDQGVIATPVSLVAITTGGVAPWTKVTNDVTNFPALA